MICDVLIPKKTTVGNSGINKHPSLATMFVVVRGENNLSSIRIGVCFFGREKYLITQVKE